jgi:O-antigen ligase
MTAKAPDPGDSLSSVIRRLARAYREAAIWQQLAVLTVPLLVYSLTQTTWVLAGTALFLGILFTLRLDLGLLLIVFTIPFAFTYKQIGADIVSLPEMLTLVCFIAWAARNVGTFKRSNVQTFKPVNALDWGVIFFVAAAIASLLVAEDINTARWELRILIIEPALLYLMVRSGDRVMAAGQDPPEINLRATTQHPPKGAQAPQAAQTEAEPVLRLADALVAGAVVVSVVGLYQYFFTDYVEAVEGVRRILSLYDSPNHLSLYLGRVIPISFCLAALGVTRWRRIVHGLALIPLVLCLYLTYSRGAWLLGLPAALLFIGVMRGRWGRILALGGMAAALLALLPVLRTPRIATLLTLQSGTNFLRIVLWEGTARMIAAHPIFGVGLGNFMRHYPRYMLAEGGHERVVFHPHNLLLDTWTSLGIPGLAALAWIQVAFFRLALQLYRRLTTEPELQALTLGLMASMISFLAHGLVDTGFRLTDLAFVFMLTLGIVSGLSLTARPRST